MARALQSALITLILSACALCNCPDPEDRRTVMMVVQDETAQQALTASVNVASFTLKDAGDDYVSLLWTPASLKEHARSSEVCTYMLMFNYLGVASTGGPPSAAGPVSPSLVQQQQPSSNVPAQPPRASPMMHTVQYTNNTMATHHGLPPATLVQVALHVCLLVNESTMVCVHAADLSARTNTSSGNSSRMSATSTTRLRSTVLSRELTESAAAGASVSPSDSSILDLARQSSTDVSSVGLPSGIGGVAIVAATVVILTLISIAGVAYLVYRRCRMRWDPLPSHFWTIELQNEYDAVSFTGTTVSEASGNGRGTSLGNGGSSSGISHADDHRRRLLEPHDNPYKLLTA